MSRVAAEILDAIRCVSGREYQRDASDGPDRAVPKWLEALTVPKSQNVSQSTRPRVISIRRINNPLLDGSRTSGA
jgi:hypothetical protein